MRYYKIIENGYIDAIGTGSDGIEITPHEYDSIRSVISNSPVPDDGYDYRLKEDLSWELVELPPEDEDPELSDSEALDIILGGGG